MMKICVCCGKEKYMMSWETICYSCKKIANRDMTSKRIREGEEDVDTGSSDYVFCPYCGYAIETNLGYEDFSELYEEGDHEIECPDCEKTFIMNVDISYYYETRKLEDEQ